jgi:hypothetical protein
MRVCGQVVGVAITTPGVSAAMRVRTSNPSLLDDLKSYLEAVECNARKVGLATLDVSMDRAPSPAQAEREVAIYLTTWQAMNPGSYARIVGEGAAQPPTL